MPTAVPADHPTDVSPTSDGALPEASEPAPDVRAPVCCGWGRCESFVFLVVRLETSSARIRWWFRARPAIALLHRDVDQSSGSGRPDQLGLADLVGSTHLGFIWDFGSGAYRRARSEPSSSDRLRKLLGVNSLTTIAGVVEAVDTEDLKSSGRKAVRVRVPPPAFSEKLYFPKIFRSKS